MAAPGVSGEELAADLGLAPCEATELLEELASEGFLAGEGDGWRVA